MLEWYIITIGDIMENNLVKEEKGRMIFIFVLFILMIAAIYWYFSPLNIDQKAGYNISAPDLQS